MNSKSTPLHIRIDDLTHPAVIEFLNDHLQHMIAVTPPGFVHALDLDALKAPEITFWSMWEGSIMVGCGALQELDSDHAELKSMRTAPAYRGGGIASRLLQHILNEARQRGYRRVSLETGSYAAFEPARRLYAKHGFDFCGPFSDYADDPNSVFMTIVL